jgi:hypothetical protein
MVIKIFVSWSGDRSYQFAEKLYEWLPTIVPNVKVFFSPELGGGYLWLGKLL